MGVQYKDWSEPPIGTRVRYSREGWPSHSRNGKIGTVVTEVRQTGDIGRNMVTVEFDNDRRKVGCYVSNLERINEDMASLYNKDLIGPKPEPVKEPKFVAPFRANGRFVVDANRRTVVKVQFGGHKEGSFSEQLPMEEAYDLAKVIAEALTEKFAKKSDDPSPF